VTAFDSFESLTKGKVSSFVFFFEFHVFYATHSTTFQDENLL